MYQVTDFDRDVFISGAMPEGLDAALVNDINYMLEKDGRVLITFDRAGDDLWAGVAEPGELCDEELNECLRGAHVMIVSLNHIDGKTLAIYGGMMGTV
tara:strand:+ start:453 stop:746 length:294 start_codon:yes stop_codon:yes gene_type:complete